jgi:DNA modification methylase
MKMKFNLDEYVRGDAFDYLSDISDNSVDLVFTSCPDLSQTDFDKSKDGINSYQDFQKRAVEHFSRVVKPKGFVVICQTDRRVNGSVLSNQVGKKDMYYFTFQHMLIYTYEGTIKRGGDWLRDIYVDKQEKIGNQSVWSQDFCKFVIDNLTKENDVVIDPFAGVGPVLIAARTLNRRWWGAEIADEFFNEDLQIKDDTKTFWP